MLIVYEFKEHMRIRDTLEVIRGEQANTLEEYRKALSDHFCAVWWHHKGLEQHLVRSEGDSAPYKKMQEEFSEMQEGLNEVQRLYNKMRRGVSRVFMLEEKLSRTHHEAYEVD